MEEICGFRGKNGGFYLKEKDCYKADLEYDIEQTKRKR